MELKQKIEALLFVSTRPVTAKRLADATGSGKKEVKDALDALIEDYDARQGGLVVLRNGDEVQIATAPDLSALVREYLKDETFGELTRPSLEALTIVAYRGPMTKPELEQVRGVNCSLILRNLMIRGLVKQEGESYTVTMDFLRYLGLKSVKDLPDYEKLNSDEHLQKLLEERPVNKQ